MRGRTFRKIAAAAAVLAGLTIAAGAGARDGARAIPAAMPAGAPVNCLSIPQIRETRVRDDRTIDFIVNGRRAYRVTLDQACPELGFEKAFSYATSLSQLCAQDIITVFRQGNPRIPGASCGLAPFQPVTLAR